MYSTLEFDSLKRCPRCKTVGNLNLEREDSLSMENGKLQVNKGALVYALSFLRLQFGGALNGESKFAY